MARIKKAVGFLVLFVIAITYLELYGRMETWFEGIAAEVSKAPQACLDVKGHVTGC